MSVETIHKSMLDAIPDEYDRSVGYPTYDFTRAFAHGGLVLENELYWGIRGIDVDYMTGVNLDSYVYQRKGIERKKGSFAEAVLRCTIPQGKKATIRAGTRFSTSDGKYFECIADTNVSTGGSITVRAVVEGAEYNVEPNTITIITASITNLSKVTNYLQASGGADKEDDDTLRARYYDAVYAMANGANAGQMQLWAENVDGVGNAKCLPCTNASFASSNGECVVLITDTARNIPTTVLVNKVQSVIDPNKNGDGSGLAPVGCKVTVKSPEAVYATIAGTYTGSATVDEIKKSIDDYFDSVALRTNVISYSRIMRAIINTDGVDECDITVNGGRVNITMEHDYNIGLMGTVSITRQTVDLDGDS